MLCDRDVCTGCGACESACPRGCLHMELDDEGFYQPRIGDGCVSCGLCEKACPVLNKEWDKKRHPVTRPTVYAAIAVNDQLLAGAASGGAFSVLADRMLEKGGSVYGVAWDEQLHPAFRRVTDRKECSLLGGSKYAQARPEKIYAQVKRDLKAGQPVLFSGTPCQIAGLYAFLDGSPDGLITCEIVCHGVPSPGLFADYLRQMEARYGGHITAVSQTYKKKNWSVLIEKYVRLTFDNGCTVVQKDQNDPFLKPFLYDGMTMRRSCGACPYAKLPRIADLTAADFSGLGVLGSCTLDCRGGVSQILVNDAAGRAFFEECRDGFKLEEHTLAEAASFNLCLWRSPKASPARQRFFDDYRRLSYAEMRRKYMDQVPKHRLRNAAAGTIKAVFGHKTAIRIVYRQNRNKGIIQDMEAALSALEKEEKT